MSRCRVVISTALFFLLTQGCSDRVRTYPTVGQVKLSDGSPLPAGFISFRSVDHPEHLCARGTIRPDGTFELMTFVPGDGAVIGKHQVLITTPTPTDRPGFASPRTLQIDTRFASYDTSGVELTVSDDAQQNHFTIDVGKGR